MANDGPVIVTNPNNTMDSSISETCLGSCSLKRKRPPKIEIPNVLREISTDNFKRCGAPKQTVCFTESGVGVLSLKGKKKFMEDSYKIFSSSNGSKGFFGVYDGHGGSKAAEFVAENLHLNVIEMLERSSENKVKEEAVKAGYLKTDEEFLKLGLGSGSCCVTALIEGKEMIVSNLGDCRAVLSRNGMAEDLTIDHRPTREDERRRIEDKGGYVEFHRRTWRVHGTLAVSRSIGDSHLKNWVVAEPDTKVIHLTPDMEYLVLASDGLWEEVSNQEAVDIVMKSCSGSKKQLMRSHDENENKERPYPCSSASPISKSPRISLVKSKRKIHPTFCNKTTEDDLYSENLSPPSKSQRISLMNQMKIKSHSPNNENQPIEKPAHGGLIAACKELVDLAVNRDCLDDVTVMIVDLNHYKR